MRALVASRFELLQELGCGSSGTVLRARLVQPYGELAAGAEVAIKFLRSELDDDERAGEAFKRAVALAKAGDDRLGEPMARGYLVRLGADDPSLPAFVDELALSSRRGNLLLAHAGRGTLDDAGRAAQLALLAATDLPLSLRLRTLAALDRPASARALVRTIALRFAHRAARRRFLGFWHDGYRV
ncbi:MAG: hypothetical protein FJ301_00140 [Planctomycetes bacterium]|nr:hypothetical protein [Planctomycetota bacterium]